MGQSINMIQISGSLYGTYLKFINCYCSDLGIQILDFLIESVQGPCNENQCDLVENGIVDQISDFISQYTLNIHLKRRGFTGKNKSKVDEQSSCATELILSLLEANDDQDIITRIKTSVDK